MSCVYSFQMCQLHVDTPFPVMDQAYNQKTWQQTLELSQETLFFLFFFLALNPDVNLNVKEGTIGLIITREVTATHFEGLGSLFGQT